MKALALLFLLLSGLCCCAQDLSISYGPQGIQQIAYRGEIVSDLSRWPEDGFHIWHMKAHDGGGHILTTGQYGWGENHTKRDWDAASRVWTYTFVWGTIKVQYLQRGDSIDVVATTVNHTDSGVILDGATIYPLTLHLQSAGVGPPVIDGKQEPGVSALTWKNGKIVAVTPNAGRPIWSGFEAGKDGSFASMVSGTKPDSLGPGSDREGLHLRPGETTTFTMSLRFLGIASSSIEIAADAYRNWAEHWPAGLTWKDRRIIGTVFLASSPQGEKTVAAGFPHNPRRFFSDASVDVQTAAGIEVFQDRVLKQAETIAANLQRMDAQGMVTWDIEGEEFPQDTSYVCAPDMIGRAAPEMESIIGPGSQYAGMKLVDAYFKTIRDAGFRVGVCVRPQRFILGSNHRAHQEFLTDKQIAAELIHKMRYAHDRWGATLFYLDSTVREDGATLDASILEEAASALPDSLLIPEESSYRMYRATAPFMTFLFHGDLTTSHTIRAAYPTAFGVNLINDVDPKKLLDHRSDLMRAVRQGDILMVHAGYWHENNLTVTRIYQDAKRAGDAASK